MLAGEPQARLVESGSKMLFPGASQGSGGDCVRSQGGAGLLEAGGAIHGDSIPGVLERPSTLQQGYELDLVVSILSQCGSHDIEQIIDAYCSCGLVCAIDIE